MSLLNKSWKLFSISKISIELHWSFIVFFGITATLLFLIEPTIFIPTAMIYSFLFGSIVIHELCHSLMAQRKGIGVSKIVLTPIGGVAVTKEVMTSPFNELLIASAGPLFNFAVVAVLMILSLFLPIFPASLPSDPEVFVNEFWNIIMVFPLFALFYVNLILGLFNLFMPALPMDGGRVLRSILALIFDYERATIWVSRFSKFFAIVLAIFAITIGHFVLIIISIFIYLGSESEAKAILLKSSFNNEKVSILVNKSPILFDQTTTLDNAYKVMRNSNTLNALVKLEASVGIVNVSDFKKVKDYEWQIYTLGEIIKPAPVVFEDEPALNVLSKMSILKVSAFPVINKEKMLIGIVDNNAFENFMKFKKMQKK